MVLLIALFLAVSLFLLAVVAGALTKARASDMARRDSLRVLRVVRRRRGRVLLRQAARRRAALSRGPRHHAPARYHVSASAA